jgi:hypothetical protein
MEKNLEGVEITRTYQLRTDPPVALVIYCLDPRFKDVFPEFLNELFNGANYAPIVLAGSIHPFGVRGLYPGQFESLNCQIDFVVKELQLKQAILINHHDCRWYQHHQGYNGHLTVEQQLHGDLLNARNYLREHYPNVQIVAYQACKEGNEIHFERVN